MPINCRLRHNTGLQQTITTTGAVLTDHTLLSIEQTVSALCDFLVDEICRQTDDKPMHRTLSYKGRGRPPARARGRGRGRGRDTSSVTKVTIFNKKPRSRSISQELSEDNEPSVVEHPQKRCSRRIQALQEKKALEMSEQVKREQQRIEQMAKKRSAILSAKGKPTTDDELSNQSTRKGSKRPLVESDEDHEEEEEEDDEEVEEESNCSVENSQKQKKRRRRKGGKPGAKPWEESDSSKQDSDESEEIEEPYEEDDDVLKFTSDDEDEFACEEPEPDAEPIVVRRARTVRKIRSDISDNNESSSESEVENDDKPCGRCGKYDHPEWILLCDKCDDGFHTACLRPPLMLIPVGDWFCPPCEHKMLCLKLSEELTTLSVHLVKKEREELRKQRLKFVDISVSNILKKQNSNSNRRKGSVSKENGTDLTDDLITSIVDNENEDNLMDDQNEHFSDDNLKKKSKNLSKRMAANQYNDKEDNDCDEDDEEGSEDDIGKAVWSDEEQDEDNDKYVNIKSRRNRNRKNINYQFTEFDQLIKSAIEQDLEYEYDVPATDPLVNIPESKGKDISNIIADNTGELDFSVGPVSEPIQEIATTATSTLNSNESPPETDFNELQNDKTCDQQLLDHPIQPTHPTPIKDQLIEDNSDRLSEPDQVISDQINQLRSESKRKRANHRPRSSARKRHRGLNDLSDTEEEDDSDEDFKGEDSATEVEDGSDEEFVDDASTQDDEEVSEDSNFKYNKRRSGRQKASKKSNSKTNLKSGRRKGYGRNAFVVSSDDSDDYKPGRSAKSSQKTRTASRKRISYREETTTEEESEEEYYSKSNKTKSKNKTRNQTDSSSEEEWGGRKAAKSKKSKNSSEEEEEDDEEEEEDNDDDKNENEEEEEESDEEVVNLKPGPKSSKPIETKGVKIEGKSRLSKARDLLNLIEDSDVSETLIKVNKTKNSRIESDSDEEENQKDDKSANNPKPGVKNVDPISCNKSIDPISDDFEIKSKSIESLEKMVTNSGINSNLNINQLNAANNQLSSDTILNQKSVTQMLAQQLNNYPPLKTTTPSTDMNTTKSVSHDSRSESFDKSLNQNSVDPYYGLTSLESYPTGPPPLKPTIVSEPYVQQLSPPRILTLESTHSTTYPRHPHLEYVTAGHPMPKMNVNLPIEPPFVSGRPVTTDLRAMPQFSGQQPNIRPDLRPSVQRFTGISRPPYYQQIPASGHPYYSPPQEGTPGLPPFNTGQHNRPPIGQIGANMTPLRTMAPITSSSIQGQSSASVTSPNFRPCPPHGWNQAIPNRSPIPGYDFGGAHTSNRPPYYTQQLRGHPAPPHVMRLPPNPYPGGSYPQNYGYFGHNVGAVTSPNATFMIQNLLQQRPPVPEETPHHTPRIIAPLSGSSAVTTATAAVSSSVTPAINANNSEISVRCPQTAAPIELPSIEPRTGNNNSFTTY